MICVNMVDKDISGFKYSQTSSPQLVRLMQTLRILNVDFRSKAILSLQQESRYHLSQIPTTLVVGLDRIFRLHYLSNHLQVCLEYSSPAIQQWQQGHAIDHLHRTHGDMSKLDGYLERRDRLGYRVRGFGVREALTESATLILDPVEIIIPFSGFWRLQEILMTTIRPNLGVQVTLPDIMLKRLRKQSEEQALAQDQ